MTTEEKEMLVLLCFIVLAAIGGFFSGMHFQQGLVEQKQNQRFNEHIIHCSDGRLLYMDGKNLELPEGCKVFFE